MQISPKYALIAGNAPSLAKINYSRLPVCKANQNSTKDFFQDFAIFRTNQFYCEAKYFLGKRVDYAFLTPQYMLENHFTHSFLKFRGEYEISHSVAVTLGFKAMDRFYDEHKHCFSYILDGKEFVQKLEQFFAFMQFNELHYHARPTSGIYMCAVAVALGFKEIYIAGIDLYCDMQNRYAFCEKTPNILLKDPNFGAVGDMHSLKMDVESLEFLSKNYGVKFYSICDESPICKYIPLAQSTPKSMPFVVEPKGENYINDILIPNKCAYEKLAFEREYKYWGYSSPYESAEPDESAEPAKNNSMLKTLKDIICLPRDLWHYLNAKMGGGIWRILRQNGGGGFGESSQSNSI